MRNAALLGARLLLGSYMGIHASQKLFGKFHGPGLDGIGAVFQQDASFFWLNVWDNVAFGGILTITGAADPAGPLAIAGAMTVAAGHNRGGGLMAARGGVELPVAYTTLALTLAATGPGKYKIGPPLPGKLAALGAIGGALAAGALIAKMVTAKAQEPAPVTEPADA